MVRSVLIFLLLLSGASGFSQFRIVKRKHLRGFHINLIKGHTSAADRKYDFKIVGERDSQIPPMEERDHAVETVNPKLATSVAGKSSLSCDEIVVEDHKASVDGLIDDINTYRTSERNSHVLYIPIGAGLVKHVVPSSGHGHPPADTAYFFGTLSIICGVFSVLALFSLIPTTVLVFLCIPGVVFGIFGTGSMRPAVGWVGLVVNGLVLLFNLLIYIAIAATI